MIVVHLENFDGSSRAGEDLDRYKFVCFCPVGIVKLFNTTCKSRKNLREILSLKLSLDVVVATTQALARERHSNLLSTVGDWVHCSFLA